LGFGASVFGCEFGQGVARVVEYLEPASGLIIGSGRHGMTGEGFETVTVRQRPLELARERCRMRRRLNVLTAQALDAFVLGPIGGVEHNRWVFQAIEPTHDERSFLDRLGVG
jgi:hypothetical protein